MINVKKNSFFIAALFMILSLNSYAQEPVCHRCEEIREYNAKYHQNFEYYDEYLKHDKEHNPKEEKKTVPESKGFL